MTNVKMHALKGSNRTAVVGAKPLKKVAADQKVTVSVYLRRHPEHAIRAARMTESLSNPDLSRRRYLSRDEAARLYGASPADVAALTSWAASEGLSVVGKAEDSERTRRVVLTGTADQLQKAFGVALEIYEHPSRGQFRGRTGPIHVPANLYGVVEGVFGLDTRPLGRSRRRRVGVPPQQIQAAVHGALPKNPWPGTFFPPEVASLYTYPAATDGAGQNIAIFAFNGTGPDPHGGYKLPALRQYFSSLGVTTPAIEDVVVAGPGNDPGADTDASAEQGDATGEVMLDMCVVGSVAPRAKIFMYFTEFTEQGWVDAIHQAVTDANEIDVISISYGNPEDGAGTAWTKAGVTQVNQAFEVAVARGITICCAAGDDGSGDGESKGAHVDFPASSPYVLAVGGTKLVGSNGQIASEVVWNEVRLQEGATGGGVSAIFSRPSYQDSANVPKSVNVPHRVGRGVPDVAAVSDPETGVVVANVDGKLEPIGGTSAAAPLWAALVARLNEGSGTRCGFFNPTLYAKAGAGVLRDITRGNNGAYAAATGWDACTGLGAPNGQSLLRAIAGPVTAATSTPHDFGLARIKFDPKHPDPKLFASAEAARQAAARVLEPAAVGWPPESAPKAQALPHAPSADAPLPQAKVLLVTWTSGEARALATLMMGGNFDDWYPYKRNVKTFVPLVTGPRAPFNDNSKSNARYHHTLGLYHPMSIGPISVVVFKSGLHMAYDGPDVPIVKLWEQIIEDVQPDLVITTGTGGGIGADVLLGDVVIAAQTRFDLTGSLKDKSFAQASYPTSGSLLKSPKLLGLATPALLKPNGALLSTPRTPQIIVPQTPEANVVSTDTFAFDDSTDHYGLQGLGKCCDMGDATLGLAMSTMTGTKPKYWLSIRNASDPQIANPNHDISAASSEAEQIYTKYQMVTTAGSVIASWATILALLT